MSFIASAIHRIKQFLGFSPRHNLLAERPEYASYDIGRWSYGDLKILRTGVDGNVQIGKLCSFAENTRIMLGGEHVTTNITTFPVGFLSAEQVMVRMRGAKAMLSLAMTCGLPRMR